MKQSGVEQVYRHHHGTRRGEGFVILSKEDSEKLIAELRALNNLKLKEEHFIKIADFLPKDIEDVNKILNDVGLSEAEANAILEIVKKY